MTLKEITYDGDPVAVELAKRDDLGRTFSTTYITVENGVLTETEINNIFTAI